MPPTASPGEVAKFDALAARWWDPAGPMAPLHRMNPLRCGWIANRLAPDRLAPGQLPSDGLPPGKASLAGISILDVGCGAGLASEALAKLGASVTGLDAAGTTLAAARAHAEAGGLSIDYRQGMPEDLLADAPRFDAVVALEVIEHVTDRAAFLAALSGLVRPGGMVFLSTLNRTTRSYLFAKVGAEYLLRMLPRGTHDWNMFVTPAELGAEARQAGLRITDIAGMMPGLPGRDWKASQDVAVNYIVAARRD